MFDSVENYIWERRNGAMKLVGLAGGAYYVRRYMSEQLDEMKTKLEEERVARDVLRRRFGQTHDDISFTVMQLIQTLSEQIMQDMDVEGLTRELQVRSTKKRIEAPAVHALLSAPPGPSGQEPQQQPQGEHSTQQPHGEAQPHPEHPQIQIPSSTQHQQDSSDERPPSSISVISSSMGYDVVSENDSHSDAGASAIMSVTSEVSSLPESSGHGHGHGHAEGRFDMPAPDLSASIISTSTSATGNTENSLAPSVLSDTPSTGTDASLSVAASTASSNTRTKAELWNEVKMLTLTRTLTTLYSTTLLSLLTNLQLTLLARSKYVYSIIQAERDQRVQDAFEAQLSFSNILFQGLGSSGGLEKLMAQLEAGSLLDDDGDEEGDRKGKGRQRREEEWDVDEEVESRFLTMVWWILHVGWKDVRERVRRGVEEVFEGVSLKSKLSAQDLHRLVADVRRRVEHEVTFEGTERRTNFLSSLLPSTPETVQHVLTQNGFVSTPGYPELDGTEFGVGFGERDDADDLSVSSFLSLSTPALPHPSAEAALYQNRQLLVPSSVGKDPYTQDPRFISLLEELRQIITSNDFMHVLEVSLDRATEVLFADLERDVFVESVPTPKGGLPAVTAGEGGGARIWEVEDVSIRLAGLMPGLSRWSKVVLEGVPNVLVDTLLDGREIRCLSAVVFGKFEEKVGR